MCQPLSLPHSPGARGSAQPPSRTRAHTPRHGLRVQVTADHVECCLAAVCGAGVCQAATVGYCVVSRKKTASYGTLGNTLDSNYANPSFQQGGGGSRFSIASDEDDVDDLYLRKPSGGQNDRQWFSSLRND